ncbi:MAG: iron ABC transporter substrate-binding protein [Acidobacteria bacterium]|nr:iron ABC transporter substrate-binding protein [Acidobacteriota bacterium]MYF14563.1 iron ABC transporter substrate-binding protein [Acidobacteriota bacterium]MYI96778.1 iron ABC transporter substrate-binding protein [Acidobacteriota bacterium]
MKPIFNIEKPLSAPPSGRLAAAAIVLIAATGCTGPPEPETLTIYCGRGESLVGPVVEAFQAETGIQVEIRYGGTADLAAQILEEGDQSPADVYYGQDAGALGQLASEGRLNPLPDSILDRVPARFRDPDGRWVGTTGRARVFVYNTELLTPEELPDTIQGFTDPRWKGRIGWAPTNGSFQAFVTAVRLLEGEEAARNWLEGVLANDPVAYPNNSAIYQAVADGEVELALSNHYYLFRFLVQHGDEFAARTVSPRGGGAGGLINISGGGVVNTAANPEAGERFLAYLLTEAVQERFAGETYEYPLVPGIATDPAVTPLSEISPPDLELGDLDDLRGTLDLLREVGAI